MKFISDSGFKHLAPDVLGGNSISTTRTINFTLTADNAVGTADTSSCYLFPGAGDTSRRTLPSGVTSTGDYGATWANWMDFCTRVPFSIKSMQLITNNTSNFSARLSYGLMSPSRRNEVTPYVDLTRLRQPTGNGYADSLTIAFPPTGYPVTVPQFFMLLPLLKNSYVQVTIEVDLTCTKAMLDTFDF